MRPRRLREDHDSVALQQLLAFEAAREKYCSSVRRPAACQLPRRYVYNIILLSHTAHVACRQNLCPGELQATLQQPPPGPHAQRESMSPAHLTASGVTCCARRDVATGLSGELGHARHAGSIRTQTDADLARLFSWVVRSGSRSRAAGSPTVSSGCTDSLATNHDPRALAESGDCEYDCARLSAHYFARPARGGANRTTRCFLYDKKKRAWSVNLNTAHSLPFCNWVAASAHHWRAPRRGI